MDIYMAGFGDLLQQAEQLTSDMDGDGEMPRVERNLRQIVDAGQQLWSRTTQSSTNKVTCDVKASILLGTKGFDLPKISQKLEGLSTAKTFEPIEPIRETDIQGFLKNERENAMLSVIEECKKLTFERADRLYWETMESEWEEEKHRILNSLTGPVSEFSEVTLETEPILYESVNMNTRSAMSRIEMAYAKELFLYNEQVMGGIAGLKTDLAEKFRTIFKELDDKRVAELWEMVQYMTDIPCKHDKDVLGARSSILLQTSFISQARKFLEKKYFEYMQTVVYSNLQQANLGSRPGTFFLVNSFLKIYLPLHFKGHENINDDLRVWAAIYFCMRCGNLEAAYESAVAAGDRLSDFVPYLMEYMENEGRRLNPNSEGQIKMEYKRYVRSNGNPFKRAVYIILGCDMSDDVTDVDKTTEDYIWRKLCQLHPDEGQQGGSQSDRLTLSMLQTKLLEEYGENHFNAYQQPFLYFQVLFLTAQFEAAIEFLSRIESYRCHAVHVAILLYEQNLLALPPSHQAALLSKIPADKPPMRRLNLSRLIMTYTNKFEVTDPREALQYFYILRELKGPRGVNLFMACVSELVLETREFEMLLGKIEPDGCRKPGAIDKFKHDTLAIIEKVAFDSETKGQYEDAIQLYDLAKKHEKVLEVLNKLLSQVVPSSNTPGSQRQRLESIGNTIAERYRAQGHAASIEAANTFYVLLDLMTFFNLAHSKKHQEALDAIRNLKLLPFEMEDVEHKVTAFSLYAEEVRRNFPDVLLATMNILYAEYKKSKQHTSLSHNQKEKDKFQQEKCFTYLRNLAHALITFAGMIPYRMPGDTNAKLVQLEVMMN